MSQQIIKLPFFKMKNNSIFYLNEYEYLSLKNMHLDNQLRNKILFDEGILIQKKIIKKNKKILEKILIIEPHPDDFALSASGYALKALSNGASIIVLNIFSKTSIKKFPWNKEINNISNKQYEKLRINESLIAVEQYLGEKFESLKLSAPNLKENIKTFSKIYHQNKLINNLTKRLVKKIIREKINTVLCPMAIQGHIAHSVIFDATVKTFQLLNQKIKFILYEDMPYARNKTAYFNRLKQIKKQINIEKFYIPTDEYLEIMADLIIIYRSQFNDVNRQQMLAIIKKDFRTISSDQKSDNVEKGKFSQRYFKIKSLK